MSIPSPGDVHVDRMLTGLSVAFLQKQSHFVADKIFPVVETDKQSDLYPTWDRSDFQRDEALEVGPSGEAPIGAARLSTTPFKCKVYKWAKMLDEQTARNADAPLALDQTFAAQVMQKLLIRRERQVVSTIFTTNVWTGSTTGTDIVPGTKWDVYATSTPVTDIEAQIFNLMKFGLDPMDMTLTLPPDVFRVLKNHPDFLDRYENVMPAILNEELMAAVLGIGKVVVPKAAYVTSVEAAAATTQDFAWSGDKALLTYAPKAPALNTPSAGYLFGWNLFGSQSAFRMLRWWRQEKSAFQIQGECAFDPKVVSSVCGVLFNDVLT